MNIRIKFEKYSSMRFLGHLDLMRYFQKALRRAEFPLEFSKGFHPHPIMSFAQPLSVGVTSAGEYFDVTLCEDIDLKNAKDRLNSVLNHGICVTGMIELPEKAKNAMSQVAAARYLVYTKDKTIEKNELEEKVNSFLSKKEILYTKKTKKNEVTKDIKPFIYELFIDEISDSNTYELPAGMCINMLLKSGSEYNLQPMPVARMILDEKYDLGIHRVDTYMEAENGMIPMI